MDNHDPLGPLTRRIMAKFKLRHLRDAETLASMVLDDQAAAAARLVSKWTGCGRGWAYDALVEVRGRNGNA